MNCCEQGSIDSSSVNIGQADSSRVMCVCVCVCVCCVRVGMLGGWRAGCREQGLVGLRQGIAQQV